MEIKFIKEDKDNVMVELDNLTIAEVLRHYLNKQDGVELAAWKREHIEANPVLHVKTKGKDAKKIIKSAISAIEKDIDKFVSEVKKVN